MKKLLMTISALALSAVFLTGCGEKVQVPPAHVGKILTKNGYAPESKPPSKFRLPPCMAYCDKLVVAEVSDTGFRETMKLFMPKDKLNLDVEVRGTMSVPKDEKSVNALFDRLVAQETPNGDMYHSIITAKQVYKTYGKQALRGIIRSELVKYNIADILKNRESISQNIHNAIVEKMKSTSIPLRISRFELSDIQPPSVIVKAQEAAKEREIAVQQANADAKVKMVQAERDLEIAKKNRLVEREKAMAIAEQNKIAAKSVTPELLMYRRLEVTENVMNALSKSDNVIVVPADMSATSGVVDNSVFAKLLGKELNK